MQRNGNKNIAYASRSIIFIIISIILFAFLYTNRPKTIYAEESDILKVRVIEDNNISLSNGKYIALDISCEKFLEFFSYNDIVTVTVNNHSYDVPVCSTRPSTSLSMYYLYLNFTNKNMFGENFDHIYLASKENLLQIESGIFKTSDSESTDKYIFNSELGSPLWAEIKLKEINGFSDYEAISNFVRTAEREDYPDLSDEEFANFRMITSGNIKEGILYRSSSPIDSVYNRNIYADSAAENAGIMTILNLANNQSDAEALAGYYDTYYSNCNIFFADMPLSLTSDEFKHSLKGTLCFMCENRGPYLIHCAEGKYRTGIISALLECLMGADMKTIQDDFLITYENFYTVYDGTQQSIPESLKPAIRKLVYTYLSVLFNTESLDNVDLSEKASTYIKQIGLTDSQITQLRNNLSDNNSGIADTPDITVLPISEDTYDAHISNEEDTEFSIDDDPEDESGLSNNDSPKTGDGGNSFLVSLIFALIVICFISTYKKL